MPKFNDVFIDRQWQLEQCVRIARDVCENRGVLWAEMISPRVAKHIVNARHEYFARAYNTTKASLVTIGRVIDKDHTTVMHALRLLKSTQVNRLDS